MNSTNTSIGRGPAGGGNENHDGDATKTTLGETVGQERPAGSEPLVDKDKAGPAGPNVGPSPWEVEAARGQPHKP